MSMMKKSGQNLAKKTPIKKKLIKNNSFSAVENKRPINRPRRKSIAAVAIKNEEKQLKTEENKEKKHKFEDYENQYNVKYEDVKKAIEGVIKFTENNPKLKNELFNEKFPLYLQINTIKVPDCHPQILRLHLAHSYYDDDDEICLIVPDVKNINNREYEKHYEHYEEILKKNNINNVKKFMTFHELKWEYETFEQIRRLVDLYDCFLVDGRISGKTVRKCGSIFYKKRKVPTSIRMFDPNLKGHFDKVLKKSPLFIRGKGDAFTVQFGKNKMNVDEMVENVYKLLKGVDIKFPGGFNNIRSITIFAHRSLRIPIYTSLKKPNDVVVEIKERKKPKHYETVVGELSTKLDSEVVVEPEGTVTVRKLKRKREEENEEEATEKVEEEEEDEEAEFVEGSDVSDDEIDDGFEVNEEEIKEQPKKVKKINKSTNVKKQSKKVKNPIKSKKSAEKEVKLPKKMKKEKSETKKNVEKKGKATEVKLKTRKTKKNKN